MKPWNLAINKLTGCCRYFDFVINRKSDGFCLPAISVAKFTVFETDDFSKSGSEWFPANEILFEDAVTFNNRQSNDIEEVNICSERLLCIKASTVSALISNVKLNFEENLFLAEKNHSDLIPSKYEGGLKLWECTRDVAQLLNPSLVSGKDVLDLGCGLGLLGILALRLGANSIIFQDYNADVLRCVTISNVRLNVDESQLARCRFFSGDWASFADLSPATCDLVVTSETIYNPANHAKLHDTISRLLRPGGTALVGAKSYYFGVGGSMKQFENLVKEKDVFHFETVWKCSQGVQREILKLTFKNEKS